MKKLAYYILIVVCICSFALFMTACGNDDKDSATGLKVRNIDGVYTVVGYSGEEGITDLVIDTYTDSNGTAQKIGAIKNGAFKGNTTLKKLYISQNVTEIGSGAFAGMTSLEYMSLPFIGKNAVAYDNERLFGYVFGAEEYDEGYRVDQKYNADNTATCYLPETLTSINISYDKALANGENYQIRDYAFYNVIRLQNLTFDVVTYANNIGTFTSKTSDVTAIGNSAFENCYGLASIKVPDSVETIGERAFVMCANLNTVMGVDETTADVNFGANSNLTTIKKQAFMGTNLTAIALPSKVTTIGEFAFATEETSGEVTAHGASKIKTVTLPNSVKNIEKYAFYRCEQLEEVTFGTGITEIGQAAFEGCILLDTLTFDGTLSGDLYIRSWAFFGCESLENLALPTGVKEIGADAFNSCVKIVNPTIPNTVATIGERAFYACSSITEYTLSGATTVADTAFASCPLGVTFALSGDSASYIVAGYTASGEITEIVIPQDYKGLPVTEIQANAFNGKTDVTKMTVGVNVTKIGDNAFNGCTNLADVSFDKNVTSIGADVLAGTAYATNKLENNGVYVGKYLVAVGDEATLDVKVGTVLIADGVAKNKTALTSVKFSTELKYIGKDAFNGSGISATTADTALKITKNVETIGENAFANITNLSFVVIDSETVATAIDGATACGSLISNATTVYVKTNIVNIGTGITGSYTLTATDMAGYNKYAV